jgi:hypothetical protein
MWRKTITTLLRARRHNPRHYGKYYNKILELNTSDSCDESSGMWESVGL